MTTITKYLGIDYGDKKIGLAIGDSELKIASPYKILIKHQDYLDRLKEICQQEDIEAVVIGVPVSLKGTQSKQTENVLNFISKLRKNIDQEIFEQDEKYTSMYAQKLLRETKAKHLDDDVAAMLILQSYLDEM